MDVEENIDYVVAIGASTGGKETVYKILKALPKDFPPILLVQHMPPVFTEAYVKFLQKHCRLNIVESKDGDVLERGMVIVATGEYQMRLVKKGNRYHVSCREEGEVNGNCPSVDVLFESVAQVMGNKGIGIVLTGIGNDGSAGLLQMRKSGAWTLCQDYQSAIAYGMPKAAIEGRGVTKQLHVQDIPKELIAYIGREARKVELVHA